MNPPPPDIDGVELGDPLGAGAAGVVYEGTLTTSGQRVAVKVLRPEHEWRAQLVERTLQEGKLCWSINHPNVVRVLDFGRTREGATYLLMERLEGETLEARLRREGALPVAAVLDLARHVSRGLCAIHARGVVHRDLKPDNLFLCHAGPIHDLVKILDLGVAQLQAGHPDRLVETQIGMILGTPGFMAPEQIRGERLDARADLFALGAVLFTALAGRPPFEGPTVLAILQSVAGGVAPPPLPAAIPRDIAELVLDLLAPAANARPASAAAVLDRVDRLQGRSPSEHARTTVILSGGAVQVGDLRVPTLGAGADHQRFRAHIMAAIAATFRPGHLPAGLHDRLARVDALHEAHKRIAAEAAAARRGADELARSLAARTARLDAAIRSVEASLEEARQAYVQDAVATMALADGIGDVDRRYVEEYRAVSAAQRQAADEAAARGEPVDLNGLYGAAVRARLAALEAAHAERRSALEAQRALRAKVRKRHAEVSSLTAQIVELRRSSLAVEAERRTRLAELEDTARAGEDELLSLDRELEHEFLLLGAAFQEQVSAL